MWEGFPVSKESLNVVHNVLGWLTSKDVSRSQLGHQVWRKRKGREMRGKGRGILECGDCLLTEFFSFFF